MPATTVSFPQTSTAVARQVAEDIAMFGHLKGSPSTEVWNSDDNATGLCCIYVNPTTRALNEEGKGYLTNRFEDRLRDAIFKQGWDSIVQWSDETPTEKVINTLRNL